MLGSAIINETSNKVIDRMHSANIKLRRLYLGVSVGYGVFCLPWLWPFQTYLYAIIIFLGSLQSPAQAFVTETRGTVEPGSGIDGAKSPRKMAKQASALTSGTDS
jgi:hypothetical protein